MRLIAKNLPMIEMQLNRATLRSGPTQAVRYTVKNSDKVRCFFFSLESLKADKPWEFEG